jgi:hypothetical protein
MSTEINIGHEEIEWEGADCTHVAHDRDQWLIFLHTVMKISLGSHTIVAGYTSTGEAYKCYKEGNNVQCQRLSPS